MSGNEWEHLLSVVQRFVDSGNSIVGGGFEPNQGGWTCTVKARLDRQLGNQAAAADPRLSFDPEADELSCSHCWAVIAGGDAAGPNGPARPRTDSGEQDQTE